MSRRSAPSLSILRSRLDQLGDELENKIDAADSITGTGDELTIRQAASDLRAAKTVYAAAHSALAAALRRSGASQELREIDTQRDNRVASYVSTRDALQRALPDGADALSITTTSTRSRTAEWVESQQQRNAVSHRSSASGGEASAASTTSPTVSEARIRSASQSPHRRRRGVPTHDEGDDRVGQLTKLVVSHTIGHPTLRYDGHSSLFTVWKGLFNAKFGGLNLTQFETIEAILAHTVGEPHELVSLLSVAAANDPARCLKQIWSELENRFGGSATIAADIAKRVNEFSPIKQGPHCAQNVRKLSDLCTLISTLVDSVPDLAHYNTSGGMTALRAKLPPFVLNRWRKFGCDYETATGTPHPPFSEFAKFLHDVSQELNARGYDTEGFGGSTQQPPSERGILGQRAATARSPRTPVRTSLAAVAQPNSVRSAASRDTLQQSRPQACVVHRQATHASESCRVFLQQSPRQRRNAVFTAKRCFRCFGNHLVANCHSTAVCENCASTTHHSLLHFDEPASQQQPVARADSAEAETGRDIAEVRACFASLRAPRSCGKTLLVDVLAHGRSVRCFAIVDEQSSSSFVSSDLVQQLGCLNKVPVEYSLTTLDRSSVLKRGLRVTGLAVRGVANNSELFELPALLTSDSIPDTCDDFACRHTVAVTKSVACFADMFPPRPDAVVRSQLLIGRDAATLMWSKYHTSQPPFVVETKLGWSILGPVAQTLCPDLSGTSSVCCLTDHFSVSTLDESLFQSVPSIITARPGDHRPGLSQDDCKFLAYARQARVTESGQIEIPLPRRDPSVQLPNNRAAVQRRMQGSIAALSRRSDRLAECVSYMQKMLDNDHVEMVPANEIDAPAFYVPIFPVVHPKKGKTRLVFDSAAQFDGVSLNSILLQGPDETNRLAAVLLRFREGAFAVVADVQTMFHCFRVPHADMDLMRFLWFDKNQSGSRLVPYRAKVHIFGNTSSPAVATFGLRFAASLGGPDSAQAQRFITEDFYVDDGLLSTDSAADAVAIVQGARDLLAKSQIRLHKIASNSKEILNRFPASELAESTEALFTDSRDQRALGVAWNVEQDVLSIAPVNSMRAFTKRGVVALANSVFDPLGLVSPIVLAIRLLLRLVLSQETNLGWDEELPQKYKPSFETCQSEAHRLQNLTFRRSFAPQGGGKVIKTSLHVFSDASCDAIGYAIYVRTVTENGAIAVSLAMAGSKVSPKAASTIPRLELCAAVAAARAAKFVETNLKCRPSQISFYTDSQIVLGYLRNQNRRFSVYVSNRVTAILALCSSADWNFVQTADNAADSTTRPQTCAALKASNWAVGPDFLKEASVPLVESTVACSDVLPETLTSAKTLSSAVAQSGSFIDRLFRLSRWQVAVGAMIRVLLLAQLLLRRVGFANPLVSTAMIRQRAISMLVAVSQRELLARINSTQMRKLSPFESDGLLRVGGRLGNAPADFGFKHPILLDNKHPISLMLIRYHHEKIGHQGRRLTAAALRDAGFLIVGSSHAIRSALSTCHACRRLRAKPPEVLMADLPPDRLEARPPFENAGMDVFGPYAVRSSFTASTRRTPATSKIWILLVCCLYSRAVHLELLFGMSSASFINAFRRFSSLRGACRRVRCDRGTNFVGAAKLLTNSEETAVVETLSRSSIDFAFNPPNASNFGGVFETKIRAIRRVLDQTVSLSSSRILSLDEFSTLVAEAAHIVNTTPYCDCADSELQPLSPADILFAKRHTDCVITQPSEADLTSYGPNRWRKVQYLADQFWSRWRAEYMSTITSRAKWLRKGRNFIVGDVVLLADKATPRCTWSLAIVEQVTRAADGVVRRVIVRVSSGRRLERASRALVLVAAAP